MKVKYHPVEALNRLKTGGESLMEIRNKKYLKIYVWMYMRMCMYEILLQFTSKSANIFLLIFVGVSLMLLMQVNLSVC